MACPRPKRTLRERRSPNPGASPERKVFHMDKNPKVGTGFDPCGSCLYASDPDGIGCIGCPNNPYPYDDYFETHQL